MNGIASDVLAAALVAAVREIVAHWYRTGSVWPTALPTTNDSASAIEVKNRRDKRIATLLDWLDGTLFLMSVLVVQAAIRTQEQPGLWTVAATGYLAATLVRMIHRSRERAAVERPAERLRRAEAEREAGDIDARTDDLVRRLDELAANPPRPASRARRHRPPDIPPG